VGASALAAIAVSKITNTTITTINNNNGLNLMFFICFLPKTTCGNHVHAIPAGEFQFGHDTNDKRLSTPNRRHLRFVLLAIWAEFHEHRLLSVDNCHPIGLHRTDVHLTTGLLDAYVQRRFFASFLTDALTVFVQDATLALLSAGFFCSTVTASNEAPFFAFNHLSVKGIISNRNFRLAARQAFCDSRCSSVFIVNDLKSVFTSTSTFVRIETN
jgi:hypothetical protein